MNGGTKMDLARNIIGDYEDEVGAELRKAKKKGCAKTAKKVVDNIL